MRVEDLSWNSRNPWQLLGNHDTQKNNQDLICQNALGSHKGKDVSGKDLAEKLKVKQVKMNMNTFSRDKESEEATMEKQCVGNGGTVREQSSAMKFLVSTLQHRPVSPTWVKNSAQFGQDLQMSNTSRQSLFMQQDGMQVSEYGMLQKVEETRRKLREGYQNAEYEKQHAIQVIDANDPCANQQHKRFRLHNVRKN